MDPSSPRGPHSRHPHAVRFYDNPQALARIVADFLADGIVGGAPALLFATPEHRTRVENELRARGLPVDRLYADATLQSVDASATVAAFMRDGMPDAALFRDAIVPIIEAASRRGTAGPLRAYGEMVDLLWRSGQSVAAVRLEVLWNELARSHEFSLHCGYAMGSFYKSASIDAVVDEHTHLVDDSGELVPVAPAAASVAAGANAHDHLGADAEVHAAVKADTHLR